MNIDNILSVEDIETMTMTDIVYAYSNGYSLDTSNRNIHGLDITTWFGEESCVGTAPNQTCVKNGYIAAGIGIVALVLLTR